MEGRRTTTELLIRHAIHAGALWKAAREHPDASVGLTNAAGFHHAKVAAFAGEICADAARYALGQASAAMSARKA